jgi:hypothetical protein
MKTNSKILQIPLPGGSGRAPTGAIQFQDDWPGLFVRGDNAIKLRSAIRILHRHLGDHNEAAVRIVLSELAGFAEIIEREVMVPRHVPKPNPLE